MAALDFPNAPINGQQYSAPNGAVYTYDGSAWTVSGVISTGTSAGGDLTGTYPNPTVAKSSAFPFAVPGDATNATVLLGNATAKGRVQELNGTPGSIGLLCNRNWAAATQDDATKSSWAVVLNTANDWFQVQRSPPGSATVTNLLGVQSDGKTYCTLADASVTQGMTAAGATFRQGTLGGLTGNFTSLTLNAWLGLGTAPNITTRGGPVLVHVNSGFMLTVNPTGGAIYFSIQRSATILFQVRFDPKSPVTANTAMPVPSFMWWDTPAAGTYSYTFNGYQTTNVLTFSNTDSPGYIRALELS